MPAPQPLSPDDPTTRTDAVAGRIGPGPVQSAVLWVGVVVTAVSLLGLLGALAAYATDAAPSFLPALYAASLFGLPLGFSLLVLYVVVSAVRRARR